MNKEFIETFRDFILNEGYPDTEDAFPNLMYLAIKEDSLIRKINNMSDNINPINIIKIKNAYENVFAVLENIIEEEKEENEN